jgi:hypothetical protein
MEFSHTYSTNGFLAPLLKGTVGWYRACRYLRKEFLKVQERRHEMTHAWCSAAQYLNWHPDLEGSRAQPSSL